MDGPVKDDGMSRDSHLGLVTSRICRARSSSPDLQTLALKRQQNEMAAVLGADGDAVVCGSRKPRCGGGTHLVHMHGAIVTIFCAAWESGPFRL